MNLGEVVFRQAVEPLPSESQALQIRYILAVNPNLRWGSRQKSGLLSLDAWPVNRIMSAVKKKSLELIWKRYSRPRFPQGFARKLPSQDVSGAEESSSHYPMLPRETAKKDISTAQCSFRCSISCSFVEVY